MVHILEDVVRTTLREITIEIKEKGYFSEFTGVTYVSDLKLR